MNTKTVKEKLEKLLNKHLILEKLTTVDEHVEQEWEGEIIVRKDILLEEIDKLYRKEITKEVVNMPIDLGRFGYGDSLVTVVTKTIRQVEEGLKQPKPRMKVLKKMPKEYWSYTCCNIEVSEPKGTEVMCPECKEWVTTK